MYLLLLTNQFIEFYKINNLFKIFDTEVNNILVILSQGRSG